MKDIVLSHILHIDAANYIIFEAMGRDYLQAYINVHYEAVHFTSSIVTATNFIQLAINSLTGLFHTRTH
jgi:hypothetical protein